jgi:S-layer protein
MNMISTGAFQKEMDASSKQQTVAEKFAAVWEKKNTKAARTGGVSLMALSLAACGSDDSTTTTTTATTTTTTTATPTAQSFTLTTAKNIFTGEGGADTFTGTGTTFTSLDALDGGAGSDTLTITDTTKAMETGVPAGSTVTNIETINVDASGGIGGATAVAQVNTYAAITVTADVAQANQYTFNTTGSTSTDTYTYGGNAGSFTYNGSTAATSATAFAAAINATAGSTVGTVGKTITDSSLSATTATTSSDLVFTSATSGLVVGMSAAGTGVTASSFITAISSDKKTITLNQNVSTAVTTATGNLTFGGGTAAVTVNAPTSGTASPALSFGDATTYAGILVVGNTDGSEGNSVTVNYGGLTASYLVGATATASGTNLAAAINTLAGSAVAVNASGVVTVTSATAGTALPAISFTGAAGDNPSVTYTTANAGVANGQQYDMSGFTGLTNVVGTSEGGINLKLAATTDATLTTSAGAVTLAGGKDITLTHSATAANNITVSAGADVTVTANKATSGTVTLTKPTGDVDVNYNATTFGNTVDTTLGAVTVSSAGATADVTTVSGAGAATLAATNFTVTQGAVGVTGSTSTTTVNVAQDAAATAAAGATVVAGGIIGVVAGAVTIADKSAASATVANTINTVSLTNFGASTIDSAALTTLNLTGTGGTLGVTAGALTTPVVSSLAMNISSSKAIGNITLDADYTSLAINGTGTKSTIADITTSGATAVTFTGDGELVFTDQSLTGLTTVTSTNTAGVTLGTTAVGTAVTVNMGSGNDKVVMSNSATKAIDLGAGNDQLTYGGAVATATTSLGAAAGGTGEDTIVMSSDQAEAADGSAVFNSKFTGFEVLKLSDEMDASGTLEMTALGNISKIVQTVNGANATTSDINNFASGGTIETLATGTGLEVHVTGALGGATDVLNLVNSNSTGGVEAFGSFKALNVETINLDMNDTGTLASTAATIDTVTVVGNAQTTAINVTGENGATLTVTGLSGVKTFDASAVATDNSTTAAGAADDTAANLSVTYTSLNTTTTASVAITGGTGNDVLTGNAAKDTVSGGAGDDTLSGAAGTDTLTGGAGNDIFSFATTDGGVTESTTSAHSSVSDFNALGAQATAINLSAASNVIASTVLGDSDVLSLNFTNTGSSDQAITVEADSTAAAAQIANATFAVKNGIMTLAGNGAAAVDTLAEWITEAAAAAANDGDVIAFEFSGDTYLFGQNDGEDLLIELDGVTGVDGVAELTASYSSALTNVIGFIDIA